MYIYIYIHIVFMYMYVYIDKGACAGGIGGAHRGDAAVPPGHDGVPARSHLYIYIHTYIHTNIHTDINIYI